jgi:hypothetical protein
MPLENDKQPRGDDGDHRKDDGNREQVLSFAERVGASKHDHCAEDVQNQNAIAERDQQRTDGKDKEYANQQRQMSPAIEICSHQVIRQRADLLSLVSICIAFFCRAFLTFLQIEFS